MSKPTWQLARALSWEFGSYLVTASQYRNDLLSAGLILSLCKIKGLAQERLSRLALVHFGPLLS